MKKQTRSHLTTKKKGEYLSLFSVLLKPLPEFFQNSELKDLALLVKK